MSIDLWTIGFEVVNFLVLVWLLERLLYRPVLGVIARRQDGIERLQHADAAAHEALVAERQRLDREREAVAADRARALERAHTQAREERARLEAEARFEMEQLLTAGRARLEHERADVAHALRQKSVELGVNIARRLLSLSIPSGGDGRFVDAVCDQLMAMKAGDRARLAAGIAEGSTVRVITAQALDSGQQSECGKRIAQAFGHTVDITFMVDDSLIAGIEIIFPGLVLRHSWRDALADTQAALTEEAEQGPLEEDNNGHDAR